MPRQRDVHRAGRPYKRMTVLALTFNAPAPADSFAIADSTVRTYLATERRPMWQVPLDSTVLTENVFATLPRFLGSSGAVRIGGLWLMLETAQSRGAVQLAHDWLMARTGAGVGAGIVARPYSGNGGAAWFSAPSARLLISPAATAYMRAVERGAAAANGGNGVMRSTVVQVAQWVRVGTDSVWVEPVDLPDLRGVLFVYSPTLRWFYSPVNSAPMYQDAHTQFVARLRARGLPVEWAWTPTSMRSAVPASL